MKKTVQELVEKNQEINGGEIKKVVISFVPFVHPHITWTAIQEGTRNFEEIMLNLLVMHEIADLPVFFETAKNIVKESPEEVLVSNGVKRYDYTIYPQKIWGDLQNLYSERRTGLTYWIKLILHIKKSDPLNIRDLTTTIYGNSPESLIGNNLARMIIAKSPWPQALWLHLAWTHYGSVCIDILSEGKIPALPEFKRQEGEEYVVITEEEILSHCIPLPKTTEKYA
jgi:hypothetical protein